MKQRAVLGAGIAGSTFIKAMTSTPVEDARPLRDNVVALANRRR